MQEKNASIENKWAYLEKKSNSNWSLIQSGAEVTDPGDLTEKELAERNVIYYRTTSTFWHYLFLFGTQLGDEVRAFKKPATQLSNL